VAYDLKFAERIRAGLHGLPIVEKKMFGGLGFMIHGNLACGVYKDHLLVRIDSARYEKLIKKAHVKPFDISSRPTKGWVLVDPQGCKTARQMNAWIKQGVDFALTLPPK
jgi:TfoX/Sxy family transcriptional regulator of competence genes